VQTCKHFNRRFGGGPSAQTGDLASLLFHGTLAQTKRERVMTQNWQYTTLNDPLAGSRPLGTAALGINDAGQIVGEYYTSLGGNPLPNGFLYSGGVYTTINDPFDVYGTIPFGINNEGQIVGYYYDGKGVNHGFLYSEGVYTTLNDPLSVGTTPGVSGTVAYGINDKGQVVGAYADASGSVHGFTYSAGVYITLNDPSGVTTQALGINNKGQIVGT
jgi:probable HAF family extracellular repeat protein